MNLRDSVRQMVRNYPGGADAIAPRINKSPSTLEKELRNAAGFKLGVDDAAEITSMSMELGSEDARNFLTSWAARLDCFVIPLPGGPVLGDDECMEALAQASREMHELMTEVITSLADGKISDNELVRADRAAAELVSAVQTLRRLLATRNAAGKPQGQA
jgi:hypothetical protein